MNFEFLPLKVKNSLLSLNYKQLSEIRIRAFKPITVNYNNDYYFLGSNGITGDQKEALKCDFDEISAIVFNASNFSIYTINEQLKNGYINLKGGIRMGLTGEVVCEKGQVITLKNFSSLNIRIPHNVENCSLNALPYLFENKKFQNTLVLSAPGVGKTTFVRDLALQLSNKNFPYNILIIDERGEIASCEKGRCELDVGKFADVYSGIDKQTGFINGIRSMSPNIIITDEISTLKDFESIQMAYTCGINVVATMHSGDINDYRNKEYANEFVKQKIFKRYIVLNDRNGKGSYEGIYDENFIRLY